MANENQETIAEIVEEMRGNEFDDPHLNGEGIIGARCLAKGWADRIEAAWKLECDRQGSIVSSALNAALGEGKITIQREGNAAAMREALVWLQKTGYRTPDGGWMCITLKMTQKDGKPYPIEVAPYAEDVINDALSVPPRNCDRYSHDEALEIWAAEKENGENGCFDEWLYSTAE